MFSAAEKSSAKTEVCCGRCRHFRNDPAMLEAMWPGLGAMSSGYGSVKAQDGVCRLHSWYLSYRDRCGDYSGA